MASLRAEVKYYKEKYSERDRRPYSDEATIRQVIIEERLMMGGGLSRKAAEAVLISFTDEGKALRREIGRLRARTAGTLADITPRLFCPQRWGGHSRVIMTRSITADPPDPRRVGHRDRQHLDHLRGSKRRWIRSRRIISRSQSSRWPVPS